MLKASAGPAGRPYGCQEDYLVARRGEFGRLAGILIPFLVTRQLICGAGTVAQTPRGAVYCLSRLAGPTGNGLSSVATRSGPLINTRDEPRAAAGLRRLRVTVSDPAMSETTTLLRAERYRAEHDVPLSAPEVAQADVAYHDIRRSHGLYYQAQRSAATRSSGPRVTSISLRRKPCRRPPAATGRRADPAPAWLPRP